MYLIMLLEQLSEKILHTQFEISFFICNIIARVQGCLYIQQVCHNFLSYSKKAILYNVIIKEHVTKLLLISLVEKTTMLIKTKNTFMKVSSIYS
jgi:hypothetical protein